MGFFKNFFLLTAKNFMVMGKGWLWTLCELLVPIILGAGILFVTNYYDQNVHHPAVSGDNRVIMDVPSCKDPNHRSIAKIDMCGLDIVYSYSSDVSASDLDSFANLLADRFTNFVPVPSRAQMIRYLESKNIDSNALHAPPPAYGIHFTKFDSKTGKLAYEMNVHVKEAENLGETWKDDRPYTPLPVIKENDYEYGRTEPVWMMMVTTKKHVKIQHIIDTMFLQFVDQHNVSSTLTIHQMPTAAQVDSDFMSWGWLLGYSAGFIMMPTIIHTCVEISSEKESGMKDFLNVMGVSTPVFYFSHILTGWLKGVIVMLATSAFALYIICTYNINIILILFVLILYVLAAVCFAAMISALFKTTGSALKVAILLHIMLVIVNIVPMTTPSPSKPLFSFLASLNYNAAMNFCVIAMSDYAIRNRALTFSTFFEDIGYFYNLGPAVLTLMLDIIWMLVVTFLADYVRSKTNFSVCNMLCFWRRNREEQTESTTTTDGGQSTISTVKSSLLPDGQEVNGCQTPVDINVENLVKVWSTGERAVDGMNLQAHRGQVTVLLGHNGAGKSTTFNVISGTIPATSGVVNVDPNIGLCPQGNAMFNRLTVRQHLWFFHKIKGATTSLIEEGFQLMTSLEMLGQQNCTASQLSGGQKRKLCLMMALIGNSRVVLLDEPTAGMDTGARSTVKKMLEVAKKERTILLTTHYMDEAESLGDTITIMVRGKNVAGGSPQFLKKRFGTGYMLTAVLGGNNNNQANVKEVADKVLKLTQTYIPKAKLRSCNGKQMTMVLPTDEQSKFPNLFTGLEGAKQTMGIESFGISLDTLEHVFLKVGELVDKDLETPSTPQIYDAVMDSRRSGFPLLAVQFLTMLRKRCVYGYRNWSQWIFQIFVPVAVAFAVAAVMRSSASTVDGRPINIQSMDYITAVVAVSESDTQEAMYKSVMKLLKKSDNVKIENIPLKNDINETIKSLQKLPSKMPPNALALIFVDGEMLVFVNMNAFHMVSVFQNFYANSQMDKGNISTVVRSYKTENEKEKDGGAFDGLLLYLSVALFFIFSFSFLTSAFSTFIVTERVSKFAHQQFLTGLSPAIYWTAAILYDLTVYVVTSSAIVGAVIWGKIDDGKLGMILLGISVFFFAIMPFVYAVSFMFSSPSKANAILIVWQMLAPLGVFVILALSVARAGITVFEIVQAVTNVFFPVLAMCQMVIYAKWKAANEKAGKPEGDGAFENTTVGYWKGFGELCACAIAFTLIFVLSRIRRLRRNCCRKRPQFIFVKPSEDPDVKAEQAYVQQNTGQFVLEVNALTKTYNHAKCSALSDLTFGVKAKECFGLLGTNGAGKTTTFGILTGEQFATGGDATINGRSVQENTVRLGYCPQFDAMLPDLTGRECLEIFASLIGYANPKGKTAMILKAVLMEEHADKRYKNLSGGQKRKISVGVALLAQATLTILDEPTAGIDPKARREIWSFLATVREHDNSALLLTSHSMDECEAICTKIGIMVKGQMVAVGTSQHLKTKYSNNYLLTLILPDPQKEGDLKLKGDAAKKEVPTQFPGAVERTDFTNDRILKFTIPKTPNDKWSELWQKAKQVSEVVGCKDYSITQSTLTETFLELQRETTNAARQYV